MTLLSTFIEYRFVSTFSLSISNPKTGTIDCNRWLILYFFITGFEPWFGNVQLLYDGFLNNFRPPPHMTVF